MASLSIRKLDDETYDRLRDRAARKGVFMEEEVRQANAKVLPLNEGIGDLSRRAGTAPGLTGMCLRAQRSQVGADQTLGRSRERRLAT